MYIGHAALALAAKGRRPDIPMVLLVPVSFGPDWVQWILQFANLSNRELSHSIPLVLGGALAAALLYRVLGGTKAAAMILGALWASHWPVDFVTGSKPTWPGGPDLGLMVYDHPWLDFAIECLLVVACWVYYRRSLPDDRRRQARVWLVPVGLVAMQWVYNTTQGRFS